jgi:hypothetical protein
MFCIGCNKNKVDEELSFSPTSTHKLKISDDSYNILTIIIEPYLLERLLNDQEHWNDACLSFRLNYDRKSNLYCDDTPNALNYLNIRNLK